MPLLMLTESPVTIHYPSYPGEVLTLLDDATQISLDVCIIRQWASEAEPCLCLHLWRLTHNSGSEGICGENGVFF